MLIPSFLLERQIEATISLVQSYIKRAKNLAFSRTAKDTYTLFTGNVSSAFLGFLFVLIVARALSVEEFGIFSAATNLVVILFSLADIGISSGIVNFVSEALAKKEKEKAHEYTKAALVVRTFIVIFLSSVVAIFAKYISTNFLATQDYSISYWVAAITFFMSLPVFFPNILQAQKRFLASVITDNSFYLSRLGFAFLFLTLGTLTLTNALSSFVWGSFIAIAIGFIFIGLNFLSSKPSKERYTRLLRYSGWLGVNRIVSSISGRLDVQMLAALAGATATGLYSIPSRLASFVIVLTSSFSGVLAPRFAGFGNKDREKAYLLKATLALIPISLGIVGWILIARPFILILFGDKYVTSVPVFQALAAAMIPFLFTAPSVTAITYAMKKPVFIGAYSFFQVVVVFALNYFLIPTFGPFGPTITYAVTNIILGIYTWVVVIKYYWIDK